METWTVVWNVNVLHFPVLLKGANNSVFGMNNILYSGISRFLKKKTNELESNELGKKITLQPRN